MGDGTNDSMTCSGRASADRSLLFAVAAPSEPCGILDELRGILKVVFAENGEHRPALELARHPPARSIDEVSDSHTQRTVKFYRYSH